MSVPSFYDNFDVESRRFKDDGLVEKLRATLSHLEAVAA